VRVLYTEVAAPGKRQDAPNTTEAAPRGALEAAGVLPFVGDPVTYPATLESPACEASSPCGSIRNQFSPEPILSGPNSLPFA
jgi:hypothetical protein